MKKLLVMTLLASSGVEASCNFYHQNVNKELQMEKECRAKERAKAEKARKEYLSNMSQEQKDAIRRDCEDVPSNLVNAAKPNYPHLTMDEVKNLLAKVCVQNQLK